MTSARRRALVATCWLATSIATSATAMAQEDPAPEAPTATIDIVAQDSLDSGLQALLVSLPPEIGSREVPASAFSVTQGGVARPVGVERLPNEALDVVLAIDVSGSMAGAPIEGARQAALTFVRELPADARIAIVTFGDLAQVVAPFDSSVDQQSAAISALVADGETALYDGVSLAVDQFDTSSDTRRTVVLLSDGDDTVSTASPDAVIARLAGTETRVFGVALQSPDFDPVVIGQLADASDGRLILADDPTALSQLYTGIASTLSNEYIVTWEPLLTGASDITLTVSHLGITAQGTSIYEAPPPPEVEPALADGSTVDPGATATPLEPATALGESAPFLASTAGRTLGIALLAASFIIVAFLLLAPGRPRSQIAFARPSGASIADRAAASDVRGRLVAVADRVLERRGRGRLVGRALDDAGIALRPGEFVVSAGAVGIGAALVGYLLGGVVMAMLFLVLAVFGVRAWLAHKVTRRRAAFDDQLSNTLQIMAGTLRTGYALPQVMETVARESEAPTADEFHRLVTETRLGRDFGDSLRSTAERMQCEDFEWVVRAIEIHREVGGDLSEVLDNVARTIRDRNALRRTTQALTADGRMSAIVIIGLPIAALVLLPLASPGYLDVLFDRTVGRIMLGVAAAQIVVGWVWIRRLIDLRY